MRAILSKAVAATMIAGAALAVSACNSETTAVVDNSTDIEAIDNMGAEDDMVTGMDAANAMDGNMMDNMTDGNMM
ncbi:hypothetical protein [Stakelama tenebrarum]|uniref:Circumsporozoite protein n=1 Tax=Stakelama tenebrarum TaxID=2711215 RepID=A0A6G6Y2J2_9SPHN|nr:hypothetical protein [Sphingosinithalassobacter tenebrarum]QIG79119.1 hypothetical protein G5C33_04500 [Sphingosinithalassobacter tenebrarum]